MAGYCDDCDATTVIPNFPVEVTGLNSELFIQQGGIAGVAILKCNSALADVTVQANWQDAIDDNNLKLIRSCGFQGSLSEESTTETIGACLVDIVSDFKTTITLTDIEDNADFDRFAFWANVRKRPNDFLVAYWTCADAKNSVVRGFMRASVIATKQIDDTKAGKNRWNISITFHNPIDDTPLDAPVQLAFNLDALTGI